MDGFAQSKQKILGDIAEGRDISPKGSIDYVVLDLVHFINKHPDYVTTSSCSGRIVLFYPAYDAKGVQWTFVNHGVITKEDILQHLVIPPNADRDAHALLVMKIEPFIMHIQCKDLESARSLHQIAQETGFRESGITCGNKRFMLAIRTTGYSMELPIAQDGQLLFTMDYLSIIIKECNTRLLSNFAKINKLFLILKTAWQYPILAAATAASAQYNDHHVQRYGHSMVVLNDGQYAANSDSSHGNSLMMMVGGTGIESISSSADTAAGSGLSYRSGRQVETMLLQLHNNKQVSLLSQAAATADKLIDDGYMHGVIDWWPISSSFGYLVLSGGRSSPAKPAYPALHKVYAFHLHRQQADNKWKKDKTKDKKMDMPKVDKVQEMTLQQQQADSNSICPSVPGGRWGHTFVCIDRPTVAGTTIRTRRYLLYGGRDLTQVYADIYLLTINLPADTADQVADTAADTAAGAADVITYTWQLLSLASAPSPTPVGRFFAASVIIPPWYISERNTMQHSSQLVLVHGGISQLDGQEVSMESSWMLIDVNKLTIAYPSAANVASSNSCYYGRVGHSLTALPYSKCLLLIGGVTATVSAATSLANSINNPNLIIDYAVNAQGELILTSRLLSYYEPTAATSGVTAATAVSGSGSIGSLQQSVTHGSLPTCQACRSHHSASLIYYDRASSSNAACSCSQLAVIGGGMMSLAFGEHYCPSHFLQVDMLCNLQAVSVSATATSGDGNSQASTEDKLPLAVKTAATSTVATATGATKRVSSHLLLIPEQRIRGIKLWLESKQWIDRGTNSSSTSTAAKKSSGKGSNKCNGGKIFPIGEGMKAQLLPYLHALPLTRYSGSNADGGNSNKQSAVVVGLDGQQSCSAMPVSEECLQALTTTTTNTTIVQQQQQELMALLAGNEITTVHYIRKDHYPEILLSFSPPPPPSNRQAHPSAATIQQAALSTPNKDSSSAIVENAGTDAINAVSDNQQQEREQPSTPISYPKKNKKKPSSSASPLSIIEQALSTFYHTVITSYLQDQQQPQHHPDQSTTATALEQHYLAQIPQKYEVVGDVLMIPQQAFQPSISTAADRSAIASWDMLIEYYNNQQAASAGTSTTATTATATAASVVNRNAFWEEVLRIYNSKGGKKLTASVAATSATSSAMSTSSNNVNVIYRIARKADVEVGNVLRESKVTFLYIDQTMLYHQQYATNPPSNKFNRRYPFGYKSKNKKKLQQLADRQVMDGAVDFATLAAATTAEGQNTAAESDVADDDNDADKPETEEVDAVAVRSSRSNKEAAVVCLCGIDHRTSLGWTTVLENSIAYSFDLTQVMFCSGNNTERMRMARPLVADYAAAKQPATVGSNDDAVLVIDFYAGIGYFTIPLLISGQAQRLIACEWNPNSVKALHHNLLVNGAEGVYLAPVVAEQQLEQMPEQQPAPVATATELLNAVAGRRVVILPGDNRLTSLRYDLTNLADRISLGLLPSSMDGWPLACRAIKRQGGILHVHENVHEKNMQPSNGDTPISSTAAIYPTLFAERVTRLGWIEATRLSFEEMFVEMKKPMRVEIQHLEKVKSYAPRVCHYVLDLKCTGLV